LAFSVRNVPCGTPVSVNFCSVFDKGGNWGISISGGVVSCIAAATGFGAMIAPIAESVAFVQFGYSPDRRWTTKMTFLNADHENPDAQEYTLNSHVYIGGKLQLPKFPIMLGNFDFGKIIKGYVTGTFNVDFGRNNPFSIKNMKKLFSKNDRRSASEKIKALVFPAREVSFSVTTSLTIDLRGLTNGFLTEIGLKDAKIMMMISMPMSGQTGSTRLPGGLYLTLTPPKNLIGAFLKPFINKFTNIFKTKINLKFPSLSKTKIALHIGKTLQIQIIFPAVSLTCSMTFKPFKSKCKTSGKVLEFALKGGKFIAGKIKGLARKVKDTLKKTKDKIKGKFDNFFGKKSSRSSSRTRRRYS
jgi:hypothetical protein